MSNQKGDKNLVGAVLVTHGDLGDVLLEVTRRIVGNFENISTVSIGWDDDLEKSESKIEKAVQAIDRGSGVIILTDMFGGTPSNISMPFQRYGKVEVITGVNLPMVVKIASQSGDESLSVLAGKVRDQGKRQITIAGELLGE
jgi:PTS system mannose-specific IIA component